MKKSYSPGSAFVISMSSPKTVNISAMVLSVRFTVAVKCACSLPDWISLIRLIYRDGNVKKCAVGKYPKSEKPGGIGSGCRLRLRPLPVLHRRQSQRVARIDPNAVVVDKNIAENDRFDLFSR